MKFQIWLESLKWPYRGQCNAMRGTCAGDADWVQMMKSKQPVSLKELESMVDVEAILDPDESIETYGEGDPKAQAYKSVWGDKLCYFYQVAGFEFIWVQPIGR